MTRMYWITVAETSPFERRASKALSEEERDAFIEFIAKNPLAGDLVSGTGGVRKVRWATKGRGKRGSVRVVYYYFDDTMPVFLLTVYEKADQANLSDREKAQMKTLTKVLIDTYRAQE